MDDMADFGSPVLTLAEASRFIRVSEKTLGTMARDGRIPAQKVGREWRFRQCALEEWLKGTARAGHVAEGFASYRQLRLFREPSVDAE
jgi:excisionase family DNA binding protein